MTSVIRPDTLYFGTLELHFEYISGLRTYIFKKRRPYLQNYRLFKLFLVVKKKPKNFSFSTYKMLTFSDFRRTDFRLSSQDSGPNFSTYFRKDGGCHTPHTSPNVRPCTFCPAKISLNLLVLLSPRSS